MKKTCCIPALLLVFTSLSQEAQPRSAETRFHVGTSTFFEASQHLTAGASYRYYFGKRGWAVEPEYSFMTEGSHQDHMMLMNLVKDLTRPSRKVVLYMIMGGGINFYRSAHRRTVVLGGLGWGMGVKIWANDRFFISPQFRIGHEPNFRLSLYMGFARRR